MATPLACADEPLHALLNRVRQGDLALERSDIDLLLRKRDNVPSDVIPVRKSAVDFRAPHDIFFVCPAALREQWLGNNRSFHSPFSKELKTFKMCESGDVGGSLRDKKRHSSPLPFSSTFHQYEGVLRCSGNVKDVNMQHEMKNLYGGTGVIGIYQLVALPGHELWDALDARASDEGTTSPVGGKKEANGSVGRRPYRLLRGVHFKYLSGSSWKLVVATQQHNKPTNDSTRAVSAAGGARRGKGRALSSMNDVVAPSPTAITSIWPNSLMAHAVSANEVSVSGPLKIGGIDVKHELEELRTEVQRLTRENSDLKCRLATLEQVEAEWVDDCDREEQI